MKNDTEKAKVLNAFFISFVTAKTGLQEPQAPKTKGRVWSKQDLPSVEEDQPREHLNKLERKSVWLDRLQP